MTDGPRESHDGNPPPLLRPIPRRPFDLHASSSSPQTDTGSSFPPTPSSRTPSGSAQPDSFARQLEAKLRRSYRKNSGDGGGDAGDDTPAANDDNDDSGADIGRTRSILNLTSSTLFGIYRDTVSGGGVSGIGAGADAPSEPATPWGTGAETPARSASLAGLEGESLGRAYAGPTAGAAGAPLGSRRRAAAVLVAKAAALFAIGVLYGVMVSHLHDRSRIAPVRVEGLNRGSWSYLAFWGLAGVGLGSLLPWVDGVWGRSGAAAVDGPTASPSRGTGPGKRALREADGPGRREGERSSPEWNPVVRSIGAFVGIAFAIRKLPWQSTLQVSLTLALVNPALWYLLDRSRPGFTLSTLVGLSGTLLLLLTRPDMLAAPLSSHSPPTTYGLPANGSSSAAAAPSTAAAAAAAGLLTYEGLGVATWIASVLFCSCVCFGNIGRRLALRDATAPAAGVVPATTTMMPKMAMTARRGDGRGR